MNSAETERTEQNQSQVEFQELLWIFEQDEILSIGVEEVSNNPKGPKVIWYSLFLLSTCPELEI